MKTKRTMNKANGRGRIGGILSLILVLGLGGVSTAAAWEPVESDPDLRAQKTHWQNRYRDLVRDAARLRATIAIETELYADANRRNYRRSGVRHVHRDAATKAKEDLAKVEAELATIEEDGRRAGALPGWFYEVKAELESEARRPAVAAPADDGGRNPLHIKNDENPGEASSQDR